MLRKFFGRARSASGNFVVVWWPNSDDPVPTLSGPYESNMEALDVRNAFRRWQRREKNMAQVVPMSRHQPLL